MAKQAPRDEKPFRPVDESLIRAVALGNSRKEEAKAEDLSLKSEPEVKSEEPLLRIPRQEVGRGSSTVEIKAARERTPRKEARTTINTEKLTLEKRMLLSPTESRAFERMVSSLAGELGTSLKMSHILRACTSLVLNSEQEIIRAARESERLVRPPNGDMKALHEFEKKLSKLLLKGFEESRGV